MTQFLDVATLVTLIGILVAAVNITTEVFKNLLPDSLPTSLLAFIVSMIITMIVFFAYCTVKNIAITWYYISAAIFLGIMVSYAAMFGFDKLKEILQGLESDK